MVCLIFHTAIINNRKNWRIIVKLHFENPSIFLKKANIYNARTPLPLFVFVRFSMTPLPSQRTYFWNDPYKELKKLWKLFGMKSHKWLSNSRKLLGRIPIEERAKKIDIKDNILPSTKILGIVWMAEEDIFTFLSNNVHDGFNYTKRNFLKKILTLFDPLGLLVLFTIRSKLLMQETWSAGIDWNDKVPNVIEQNVKKWLQELQILSHIKVDRCVWKVNEKHIETNISIH